jgi:hypothetical protein
MPCNVSSSDPPKKGHAPSPGMYADTSRPLLSRTRATLRSPELGFFGLTVPTLTHTPFICGRPTMKGEMRRRAGWGLRQPRRTCISVAGRGGVVVKARAWGVWVGARRAAPAKRVRRRAGGIGVVEGVWR